MKNEVWGYARVSTKEQNLARQIEQLKEFGISERNIKCDKISGKTFNRIQRISWNRNNSTNFKRGRFACYCQS